ncbi:MAG: prepilin-type N-terminal cleavage/methylation domain-containing protein [Rubrivivax sp.]|nr:prepilin-type N-terminal cleavage/methylation domain-containing protein [Rubrivivax sp.]
MPTSAPGSSFKPDLALAQRGFTLIELLVVIAIVALSAGVVSLALRDGDAAQLEEEGERLTALLETARADARALGAAVRFVPAGEGQAQDAQEPQFRFVGLPSLRKMPTRWLDARVSAQVVGGSVLVLGPDAILAPQRIVLRLADRRLELATDGLGPFAVVAEQVVP